MLNGRRIVLAVSGSIAVYKAVQLASDLYKAGAQVDVVMTDSATHFVDPRSFQSITHGIVASDLWDVSQTKGVLHVELADRAEAFVVAPATATTIARLALGIADDLLSCVALATQAPLIIAPAMESHMFQHPATQGHLETLRQRGAIIVEPGSGHLASGASGVGRLAEPAEILSTIDRVLTKRHDLAGTHVVITAGGTQEPIDPVRVITNRSSGKMGYAIAEAARDRGASVTLITAASLPKPAGINVVPVESALEMLDAVRSATGTGDALIMAAAVADFRVANPSEQKIKKKDGNLVIELVKNPDILATVRGPFVRVGFAAESQDLVQNADAKLRGKELDLVVANDITAVGSGFGSDTNRVIFLRPGQEPDHLPLLSKREVGDRILDVVLDVLHGRPSSHL